MKNLVMLASIFIIFLAVGNIRFLDDYVAPGDELFVHVNIVNDNTFDENDVTVTTILWDFDLDGSGNTFDLDSRSSESHIATWEVPDAEPDEYWVRISTRDEDGRRDVKYRPFYII